MRSEVRMTLFLVDTETEERLTECWQFLTPFLENLGTGVTSAIRSAELAGVHQFHLHTKMY